MAALPEGVGLDVVARDAEIPTKTFIVDWEGNRIVGMGDGLDAMRQAADIVLRTERFRWPIYTSNFGVELEELVGDEYDYIVSELPRRVKEALSVDSRVLSVQGFAFKDCRDGTMSCTFDVITVFGVIAGEVAV